MGSARAVGTARWDGAGASGGKLRHGAVPVQAAGSGTWMPDRQEGAAQKEARVREEDGEGRVLGKKG